VGEHIFYMIFPCKPPICVNIRHTHWMHNTQIFVHDSWATLKATYSNIRFRWNILLCSIVMHVVGCLYFVYFAVVIRDPYKTVKTQWSKYSDSRTTYRTNHHTDTIKHTINIICIIFTCHLSSSWVALNDKQ